MPAQRTGTSLVRDTPPPVTRPCGRRKEREPQAPSALHPLLSGLSLGHWDWPSTAGRLWPWLGPALRSSGCWVGEP